MTVPELSLPALRARPAHRAAVPAPSPSWLDEAAPPSGEIDTVAHVAPAHAGAAHHTPAAPFTAKAGVDIAAMVARGALIGGLVALLYVAIAGGWIGAATEALSGWWAADVAPWFAIDIVSDGGEAGTVPASVG
ncbi:hypothetical protein [Demequina sp. NBRC 110051]|uniref:hypothetical protein n=1 Tax=Demequina sp. NBRC 110051 TaxID=1570340 RepID=UPI00117FE41C|nr:hypothetical protein [Demequina sp. NBRC 110051]